MRSSWNPDRLPSAQALSEMIGQMEDLTRLVRNTRRDTQQQLQNTNQALVTNNQRITALSASQSNFLFLLQQILEELRVTRSDLAALKGTIMATLAELQAKADETLANITAETDIDNAVALVVTNQVTTITDLRTQLAAAIAAGNDPAALQALMTTMDNILALNTSNTKIVADAVTAGTPTP